MSINSLYLCPKYLYLVCMRYAVLFIDYTYYLGLDDLHNFVSVALHTTAGESDFDSDRLSNLKKVGNGFGPLIFGLMKNKSFEAFRQGCLAVWENMKSAPDLPEQLVSIIFLQLRLLNVKISIL